MLLKIYSASNKKQKKNFPTSHTCDLSDNFIHLFALHDKIKTDLSDKKPNMRERSLVAVLHLKRVNASLKFSLIIKKEQEKNNE